MNVDSGMCVFTSFTLTFALMLVYLQQLTSVIKKGRNWPRSLKTQTLKTLNLLSLPVSQVSLGVPQSVPPAT